MTDLDTFRSETRAWLEANCPAEMREPMRSEADACWGGRNWTFQTRRAAAVAGAHGGARLDRARLAEGLWRRRAVAGRDQDAQGGNGADRRALAADQLRHFDARPGAAQIRHRGAEEALSCPRSRAARSAGARAIPSRAPGRDLAGLQTKAEDKGDHWLVNGQKVWTSYADKADWIFCLVRTSTESKHGGISFLLFDMETPGRLDQADPADQRQFALLRDLLRRREGAQGPGRRRGEQGLGRRQISARPRARDDQRHGPRRRRRRRSARRSEPDRRSAAARRDRRVRRRRPRLRGDERALHRRC